MLLEKQTVGPVEMPIQVESAAADDVAMAGSVE